MAIDIRKAVRTTAMAAGLVLAGVTGASAGVVNGDAFEGSASSSNGDTISWTVSSGTGCPANTGSGYRYAYNVSNVSDITSGLFVPLFNGAADVCNIVSPSGWFHEFNGNTLKFIVGEDGAPIEVGGTLSGFRFDSNFGPVLVDTFALRGSDGLIYIDPPVPNSNTVPVPATLLLSATALALLGWRRHASRPA